MMMDNLASEIMKLKSEKNAVILAHYYQDDEIQDVADFIGDSLDLSRKAASTSADIILFCGVRFMAEVAKILNPKKKVLLPDFNAGCSLESSCPPSDFAKFLASNPNHLVLSYINCSAEVKAMSDIIVTSSNAEKIIRQIPKTQKIIFAPDRNLGSYLSRITGREMLLWQGSCIVHEQFALKNLIQAKVRYKKSLVIAHPECTEELLQEADFIGSTTKLVNFVKENPGRDFIVLTEEGIIHQMKKYSPNSNFYSIQGLDKNTAECFNCSACPHMKMNNLEKLYLALKNETPEMILSKALLEKAKKPLDQMLSLS